MITIRPATRHDAIDLRALIVGYTVDSAYTVSRTASAKRIGFELRLTPLPEPFVKRFPSLDAETRRHYTDLIGAGHVFGAFLGAHCGGIAICEPRPWNSSLQVHELHVEPAGQRQHTGSHLIDAVVAYARKAGLRSIICETQNTNVGAIRFYRRMGFVLDGLDVGLYADGGAAASEAAIFMRRYLNDVTV